MRVVIINKSDSTGGAAIVSRRLMEALRLTGVDARMLVCEKLTDSPYVELAASPSLIKRKFIKERLKIFIANGFNRSTLFKIDTGSDGLPLWRHPLVTGADAIMLNWVNQGMLSLKGVRKILQLGKPVVWTMHDMWNMTGICHHAGECNHFSHECGSCPLMGKNASLKDLSHKIWLRKNGIYSQKDLMKRMAFVAVSSWLKGRASESSLLKDQRVEVIPNAFNITGEKNQTASAKTGIRILFGAARLDDPIKGLNTLIAASQILKKDYPEISNNLEIALFGAVKNPEALKGFQLPVVNLGVLKGEEEVRKAYEDSHILISASFYETLPGTLVEAQAYGCIPVCFNRGGQPDIISPNSTGFMVEFNDNPEQRAKNLAEGIVQAWEIIRNHQMHHQMIARMRKNVEDKFSYKSVAEKYISLINSL